MNNLFYRIIAFNGSKGFNLFSALVAAVLIMIGVILTNMLISTEDTLKSEVYIMTNTFNLSDAAALSRADSLQTFNYNFRKQLEEYLTVSDDGIERNITFNLIRTDDIQSGDTWENIQNNFEKSVLLKGNEIDGSANTRFTAAIELVASKTINQFHDGRYGRYHVSLSDRTSKAIENLKNGLIQTLEDNINEVNFLEIIGCDESDCEIGTFYFIIPLDKIKPEAYEALPLIIVKDLVSGEEIKFPILPKTRLNIYIPLRFFKAVHEAWKKNSGAIIDFEDLLESGQTKQTGMLGYCDVGCEPRKNPLIAGGQNWAGKDCIGTASNTVTQEITNSNNANILLATKNYRIGEANGRNELTAFARANICKSAEETYIGKGYEDTKLDSEGKFANYNLEEGRGLSENSSMGINKAAGCPFNRINAIAISNRTKTIDGTSGAGLPLYCTSIKQVETIVIFEETNPLYIVSGEKNRYSIGIRSKEFPIQENNLGICTSGSNNCNKRI